MRRPWILAVLVAVLAAVPALGQGTKPEPGCAGVYNDKKGDAAPAQLDITGFWFKHQAGKTYAVLRLADLKPVVPTDATGANWYVLWNVGEVQYFVTMSVEVTAPDPTFSYGTVETTPNGTLRQGAGDVPGRIVEGPEGTIEWEIPAEAGSKPGQVFKSPIADTATSTGLIFSLLSTIDEATGKTYTVNGCEAGGGGGTSAPAPSAPATPTAPTSPTRQQGAAGQLDVAVTGKLPAAKKVKKSLSVGLTSKKGVTGLKATLYKGNISANKVVAKGSLAKLAGKGKLKLKVSAKLKKGGYTLYLSGRNADGQAADRKVAVKLK
jgi:hypothetical protein